MSVWAPSGETFTSLLHYKSVPPEERVSGVVSRCRMKSVSRVSADLHVSRCTSSCSALSAWKRFAPLFRVRLRRYMYWSFGVRAGPGQDAGLQQGPAALRGARRGDLPLARPAPAPDHPDAEPDPQGHGRLRPSPGLAGARLLRWRAQGPGTAGARASEAGRPASRGAPIRAPRRRKATPGGFRGNE